MAVVAYHYFPGKLPGGFVGVDVFFVISGYLITGIMAKAFASQTFSLLYFYERRIRRIFPALILVLGLCLVAGWFLLFPSEYEALGKHVAASASYLQNFVLWFEAGYFDVDGIQKPLLHLWSLAVEEQFYILWPLILWFVMRRRWPVLASITVIAGVSFALNVWSVNQGHATSAFYWPSTRAWELMIGAWLAMGHRHDTAWIKRLPAMQSWVGLALILAGIAVIRPEHFPGFWALLPTLGTALLINAGPGPLPNRRLLSWKPVVWVGLISYPLYLWHWVLWSLTIIVVGELGAWPMRGMKVVLFATSILLAWLTYQWFEKPVRRRGEGWVTVGLFLAVALLGLGGLGVFLSGGAPTRPLALYKANAQSYAESVVRTPLQKKCFDLVTRGQLNRSWNCTLGDPTAETRILVYGDSHSLSMIPALDRYGQQANIRIIFAGMSGCLGLLGIHDEEHRDNTLACGQLATNTILFADENKPSAVIIIQRWTYYVGGKTRPDDFQIYVTNDNDDRAKPIRGIPALKYGLEKTLSAYQAVGVPVVLMEDNPQQPQDLPLAKLRFSTGHESLEDYVNIGSATLAQHHHDQALTNRILEAFAARFSNVTTVNVDAALCNVTTCPWASDGKFLYYEDDHLSITGSLRVYPILARHLNQILDLDAPVPLVRTP